MKKIYLHTLLLLTAVIPAVAQKNIEPTAEDIVLAKKLREKHSKDDVAILSSHESVTFGYDKSSKKVTVANDIHEQLMNINHRADIHKYEFYDSESVIEDFSLKYRNNKSANFQIKDELYKSDELF